MNQLSTESDEVLWKRYNENDDQQAFCLLAGKYRERLLAFLIRLTGEPEEALDLLQETLRRFVQHYDSGRSSAKTFLFCIAVNLARSHYRRSRNQIEISLDELETEGIQIARERDHYQEEIRLRLFQKALNQLHIKDRETIELKDVEGIPYKEAAEIIGCSVKRFEKRLLRARKRLRAVIAKNKEYEPLAQNYAAV